MADPVAVRLYLEFQLTSFAAMSGWDSVTVSRECNVTGGGHPLVSLAHQHLSHQFFMLLPFCALDTHLAEDPGCCTWVPRCVEQRWEFALSSMFYRR